LLAWTVKRKEKNKKALVFGVVLFLLILAFFKYKFLPIFNVENIAEGASSPVAFMLLLPLPIGISFYTFQAISLIVDSHKTEYKDRLDFGKNRFQFVKNCFFYITFFPQLVAGPIVKAHEFLPQIEAKSIRDIPVVAATKAIIVGLFFKSVLADNLNVFTLSMQEIAENSAGNAADAIILLSAYSAQIYADFFGYTLLAIGVASLFGYKLPDNFNVPYISQSISEFWRRWHISLSSFLREYLYFPLGGNRLGTSRTYVNLIIVMGLGGLWHGAALSYLFWGLFHGIGLALERPFLKTAFFKSENFIVMITRTFLVFCFVSFAWIFFRFPEFQDVKNYLTAFSHLGDEHAALLGLADRLVILVLALPVIVQHLLAKAKKEFSDLVQMAVYGAMLFLFFVQRGEVDAFIYFQF